MLLRMLSVFVVTLGLGAQAPLALKGLDPVELCEGREVSGEPSLVRTAGRYRYQFASPRTWARFVANPERYGIQWNGSCARMGPISGAGDPNRFVVSDGRIYIFASDMCRDGFLTNPSRYHEPVPTAFVASDDALKSGREWITRVVAALGGAEVVDRPSGLSLVDERQEQAWKGRRVREIMAGNGRTLRSMRWTAPDAKEPGTEYRYFVDGNNALGTDASGTFALSGPGKADVLRERLREPIAILWARHRDDFVASTMVDGELDGRVLKQVRVAFSGLATILLIDPESARIVGLRWLGRLDSGMTREIVEMFFDWRSVEGLAIPMRRVVLADGEPLSEETWDEAHVVVAAAASSPK